MSSNLLAIEIFDKKQEAKDYYDGVKGTMKNHHHYFTITDATTVNTKTGGTSAEKIYGKLFDDKKIYVVMTYIKPLE